MKYLPLLAQALGPVVAGTPWIAYGVSYARGFVAWLRKVYPDIYYGAISSSGVTSLTVDYWQYYDPIRSYGPAECIQATQDFVDIIDPVLIDHADNQTLSQHLKSSMGASPNYNNSRDWDPAIGAPTFRYYCDNITSSDRLYLETAQTEMSLKEIITLAGYNAPDDRFVTGI
ncbi:hypothetical protein EYZ11_011702 [Aspergillus tanneri]|uniref:Uncharacterized protein n=1 Tax=Aspergillus tanneri TaxID=1220188 RepID=A0A4S3J7G9_9EURO|nr:hypothetical protein EYZ11_011702 [Aspergillus tanneri]